MAAPAVELHLPRGAATDRGRDADSSEAELVSLITAHGIFQEHVEQGQDGSSVVVLTPLPPQ